MKKFIIAGFIFSLIITIAFVAKAQAHQHSNAGFGDECNAHAEDASHTCGEGLICVPQNDNSEGNGKCGYIVTPTPTEEPSITPTITPTLTPNCEEDEDCITVTPTPTVTPEVTPTPDETQVTSNTGGSSQPGTCGDAIPGTVDNIFVDSGTPNDGKVTVEWALPLGADKADIRYEQYGQTDWPYSALNVDNNGHYEVQDLTNGVNYRFEVAGVNGCAVGPYSRSFDPKP